MTDLQKNSVAAAHIIQPDPEPTLTDDPLLTEMGAPPLDTQVNLRQKIAAGIFLVGTLFNAFLWFFSDSLFHIMWIMVDLVIGVSILRGNRNIIMLAAIRSIVGSFLFCIPAWALGGGWSVIVAHLIGLAGLLGLLLGKESNMKTAICVLMVLMGSWTGLVRYYMAAVHGGY